MIAIDLADGKHNWGCERTTPDSVFFRLGSKTGAYIKAELTYSETLDIIEALLKCVEHKINLDLEGKGVDH